MSLITALESSGSDEKAFFFFFQISAKNTGISQYGEAVSLEVTTQEKGKDNAHVTCLTHARAHTHTHTHMYMYLFLRFFSNMPTDSLINGIPMTV